MDRFSTQTTEVSDDDDTGTPVILRHSRKRSAVWEHFKIIMDPIGLAQRAHCQHCERNYAMPTSSTSNLKNHLNSQHSELFNGTVVAEKFVFSQEKFRKALVKWIIVSNQPFTEPEQESFVDVVHSLNPIAHVVSNDTVKRDVLKSFEAEAEKVKAIISSIPGKLSFTSDSWTSKTTCSFMAIRGHWVTSEWTAGNMLLGFTHVQDEHTGENLCKFFVKTLEFYKIPLEKVHGLTMDNASNNDTLMESMKKKCDEIFVPFSNEKNRIRCLAHIINLAVQDILTSLRVSARDDSNLEYADDELFDVVLEFDETNLGEEETEEQQLSDEDEVDEFQHDEQPPLHTVLKKLRSVVKLIRKSPTMLQKFGRFCIFHQVPFLRPVIDVKTRWNSTFKMMKRAQQLRVPLRSFCSSVNRLNKFLINDIEWKALDDLTVLLQKFDYATLYVSSHQRPTITAYVQLFDWLLTSMTEFGEDQPQFLVEAVNRGYEKLVKYKPTLESSEIPFVSTVLHPAFKLEYFKNQKYNNREIKTIKNTVHEIFKNKYEQVPVVLPAAIDGNEFFAHLSKRRRTSTNSDEFKKYLGDDLADMKVNVLDWWKANEQKYPCLALMAKDYLAVQSSQVCIEQDFSSATDLVTPTRCSLHPDTISMCMCLKMWWRNPQK